MDLYEEMKHLVLWAQGQWIIGVCNHDDLYHTTAEHFKLYDEDGDAPIWLSRVMAGVITDMKETDGTV